MKTYVFDHYYTYPELTQTLQQLMQDYPGLIQVESICTTPDQHEVWAATITNFATGDPLKKPACYADGNHHAGEVTGSMAALGLIVKLVQGYGNQENITTLLDHSTVYVIPRISPDGAELILTTPEQFRSVNRPYPYDEMTPGLHPKDMDGDGVIRMMRVKDANGVWKPMDKDPRILVKRSPSDFGGTYYNLYPEGEILGYDGLHIQPGEGKWNLDFNRNYPLGWFPESRQPGAGAYPLSNPENKAVAEFVLSHPNICCGVTFHTSGGCYIYPPGTKPEAQADSRDMRMFKEIGAMATEETGYGCFNIFDAFLTDTVNYSSGAFDDWMYQCQGIPTYTAELWDLAIRAGVPDVYPRTKPVSDQQQAENIYLCYQWLDANAQNNPVPAILPWTEFEHPQLGTVEIGGPDFKFTWQNCPVGYLEQEVEKNVNFCLRMAATLPHLQIESFTAEKQAEGVYQITAVVRNAGYLPTFVCNEAKTLRVDRPLKAKLTLDGTILTDTPEEIGHLEGFSGVKSYKLNNNSYGYSNVKAYYQPEYLKKLSWMVAAPAGTSVSLWVGNDKSGSVSASITL